MKKKKNRYMGPTFGMAIRTTDEVRDELQKRTGVNITRAAVWAAEQRALKKLRPFFVQMGYSR